VLNVFSEGVQPSEIKRMGFHDLKYWNDCHKILEGARKRAIKGKK